MWLWYCNDSLCKGGSCNICRSDIVKVVVVVVMLVVMLVVVVVMMVVVVVVVVAQWCWHWW